MIANHEVADFFDSVQPDGDVATVVALKRPTRYRWSYVLDGEWYTCREWQELREVAKGRRR